MNIHHILLEKAAQNELGHFYILESPLSEQDAFDHLIHFAENFIRDYYQQIEKSHHPLKQLIDHPDIYIFGYLPEYEDKKDPHYIPAEADHLIRFFEFKAIQSKRKFAIIPEAHKMTTYLSNKCLKLLEEPNSDATILLLNPRRQKLLDTIHSRAQHLRLPVSIPQKNNHEWITFLDKTSKQSLSQFIESNMKEERSIQFWSNEWLIWDSQQLEHTECKTALLNWLKTLDEMETFHQPTATKWTLFFSLLQDNVLKRLSH
jgi:hypothetical protein